MCLLGCLLSCLLPLMPSVKTSLPPPVSLLHSPCALCSPHTCTREGESFCAGALLKTHGGKVHYLFSYWLGSDATIFSRWTNGPAWRRRKPGAGSLLLRRLSVGGVGRTSLLWTLGSVFDISAHSPALFTCRIRRLPPDDSRHLRVP